MCTREIREKEEYEKLCSNAVIARDKAKAATESLESAEASAEDVVKVTIFPGTIERNISEVFDANKAKRFSDRRHSATSLLLRYSENVQKVNVEGLAEAKTVLQSAKNGTKTELIDAAKVAVEDLEKVVEDSVKKVAERREANNNALIKLTEAHYKHRSAVGKARIERECGDCESLNVASELKSSTAKDSALADLRLANYVLLKAKSDVQIAENITVDREHRIKGYVEDAEAAFDAEDELQKSFNATESDLGDAKRKSMESANLLNGSIEESDKKRREYEEVVDIAEAASERMFVAEKRAVSLDVYYLMLQH